MTGFIIGMLVGVYAGWVLCGVVMLCLIDYIYGGKEKYPLDERGGD